MSEKRMRGTGHVYQRGNVYWVKYSRNGKAFAESAKTNDREKAEKFLQRRLAQVITVSLQTRFEEAKVLWGLATCAEKVSQPANTCHCSERECKRTAVRGITANVFLEGQD